MLHNPDHPALNIIPRPASLVLVPGSCALGPATVVKACESLRQEADFLAVRLRLATGWEIPLVLFPEARAAPASSEAEGHGAAGRPGHFTITLLLAEDGRDRRDENPEEGYELTTTTFAAEIKAPARAGVFYGVQTLLQLFPPAIYSGTPRIDIAWQLPKVTLRDTPRFPWRGVLLDSARHFFPVSDIKAFIDQLALHKLNTLHWHLTDDQGWRIEIKKHPRLTSVGAWRKETLRGHSSAGLGGDGQPHGGFYTQGEIREIVAYAAARHVTIVPEIDMPGHSQAAIAAYPRLGSSGQPVEVGTTWGVSDEVLNPMPETLRFCQEVLAEVMELFPGRFIHIGGDEVCKTQWLANPEVRELIRKTGLAGPEELQRWFLLQIKDFIEANGRRLAGWDEILEGGPMPGATIMGWRGWLNAGRRAASTGHEVVMTPSAFTYLNHYQAEDIENEPISIGGRFISLEMAYGYDPVEPGMTEEEAARVRGIQAALWTEYIPSRSLLEYMAYPRLCALAETAWTPRSLKDCAVFSRTLRRHLRRLAILGVNHRKPD